MIFSDAGVFDGWEISFYILFRMVRKFSCIFHCLVDLGGTGGSLLVLAVWLGGYWREFAGCRWEISLLLWPLFVFFGCAVVLCCIKKRKKSYL